MSNTLLKSVNYELKLNNTFHIKIYLYIHVNNLQVIFSFIYYVRTCEYGSTEVQDGRVYRATQYESDHNSV
jgi:hypothetical protein